MKKAKKPKRKSGVRKPRPYHLINYGHVCPCGQVKCGVSVCPRDAETHRTYTSVARDGRTRVTYLCSLHWEFAEQNW